MPKQRKNTLAIYQTKSGAVELRGDVSHETLWASLDQIASIFGRDKSVISRHIKNIFIEGELKKSSVVALFATTAADGKTYQVEYFNLDVIISVGYRVNSKQATQFRQWATKTLRRYITTGFVVNKKHVAKHYAAFLKAVESVQKLLPAGGRVDAESALELTKLFASTWFSLDAYDKAELPTQGATRKQVSFTASELGEALATFKTDLSRRHEAGDLFGADRGQGSIAGIVGNVFQALGGRDVYPTVEEKAAHLLYFIVKNHPFVDGNKRSGAFAFVWFLRKAGILDTGKLTPEALTALTLLVAESNPRHKDRLIGLVLQLLRT